ncbi:MAG TPA: bifunctional diaminohydroxyphosphoribosylaminopyrimidine deaminase/5-amino-6-(5-phosphoribosylamino)uracil reductase RibD [Dehalococcoidales bacterium]|nr:bifunctional diaminohydroxyphosphoribosylaminopyrimidine deaminase/5-amino-6-(5-phosphoribosylamino)uracil reductase RibD [Dehalococcoidales bacterium]
MDYMLQALSLARLALGNVSPNPSVGAVIVKNGKVVGQGYTQPPGSDHAEIVALKEAGAKAKDATLYVTLEPCCHYGRTPPCTKALIKAGIKEVYMAMLDPNPIVAGKGKAELEKAGITVSLGDHENEAREIIEAYCKYITRKIPFITAKFAMSLDGKIATRTGDSRYISGDESRRHVHCLRYEHDAIMVGANTILTDDPQLTVRCCTNGGLSHKQPLRIVVDAGARTPTSAKIFHEPGKVLMVVGENASTDRKYDYEQLGAEVIVLPAKKGLIDLPSLLKTIGERQITSVLVEGGGTLLGSLFDAKLVDKVIAFIAPVIIGGKKAVTPVAGKGAESVIDSIKLERVSTRFFGSDIMISGYAGKGTCSPVSSKKSAK